MSVTYLPKKNTAWRAIAGETILIDLDAKMMFGLNPTAAFVWRAIGSGSSPEQVARLLGSGEAPAIEVATLEEFCQELEALGLLVRAEPGEGPTGPPVEVPTPEEVSAPEVLWQEEVRRLAATCAFLPAQNPLCTQVPMA